MQSMLEPADSVQALSARHADSAGIWLAWTSLKHIYPSCSPSLNIMLACYAASKQLRQPWRPGMPATSPACSGSPWMTRRPRMPRRGSRSGWSRQRGLWRSLCPAGSRLCSQALKRCHVCPQIASLSPVSFKIRLKQTGELWSQCFLNARGCTISFREHSAPQMKIPDRK